MTRGDWVGSAPLDRDAGSADPNGLEGSTAGAGAAAFGASAGSQG